MNEADGTSERSKIRRGMINDRGGGASHNRGV
jgi:hypothetical protein